jgi:hypothetical protein
MDTADKLMNLAIDGDTSEEVVATTDEAPGDEVVEETTVTRRVRRPRPADHTIIIEED